MDALNSKEDEKGDIRIRLMTLIKRKKKFN